MKSAIVVIMPFFYGYQKLIELELRKHYSRVFVIPEYFIKNPRYYTIFKKLSPFACDMFWRKYEERIINIVDKYSINKILIIRGAGLREEFLRKLSLISNMKIINYQWDSVDNNPNALMIAKYAKHNMTFDREDSQKISLFSYLPLFYCFEKNKVCKKKRFDILYLASWSSARIEGLKELRNYCAKNDLTFYSHLYLAFHSYISRIFSISGVPFRDIQFHMISRTRYLDLLGACIAVFDVSNKRQSGITMRTIEALALQKKVITTNKSVVGESFYCRNNFLIWPEESCRIVQFLKEPFDTSCLENILSLSKWLSELEL